VRRLLNVYLFWGLDDSSFMGGRAEVCQQYEKYFIVNILALFYVYLSCISTMLMMRQTDFTTYHFSQEYLN